MSYPIQSGAPCIGCSNPHFWDEAPFTDRLPVHDKLGDVDKIGVGVGAAALVGVAGHAVASLVQKSHRAVDEVEHGGNSGEQVRK